MGPPTCNPISPLHLEFSLLRFWWSTFFARERLHVTIISLTAGIFFTKTVCVREVRKVVVFAVIFLRKEYRLLIYVKLLGFFIKKNCWNFLSNCICQRSQNRRCACRDYFFLNQASCRHSDCGGHWGLARRRSTTGRGQTSLFSRFRSRSWIQSNYDPIPINLRFQCSIVRIFNLR